MDANELIGKKFGSFIVQELIGQGSIGAVYRAQQTSSRQEIAIKVLLSALSLRPRQRETFLDQFRRVGSDLIVLKHDNIIHYYGYDIKVDIDYGDIAYIVMPYLSRGFWTTGKHTKRMPLSFSVVLRYLEQIAAALDYAREKGVVHGGLKPTNIFLKDDGNLILTDFGMAQLASLPVIRKTLPALNEYDYLSPEQSMSREYDGRADQYALGVMLFELLTGKPPLWLRADRRFLSQVWNGSRSLPTLQRAHPNLPKAAEEVLLRALSKKPADRYATAGKFAQAFSAAVLPLRRRGTVRSARKRPVDVPTGQHTGEPALTETPSTPPAPAQAVSPVEVPELDLSAFTLPPSLIKDAAPLPAPEQPRLNLAPLDFHQNKREALMPPSKSEARAQAATQDTFISQIRQADREIFKKAMDRADLHRWESRWSDAAAAYRQALERFPDDVKAHTSLGFCLMQMEQWQAALYEYEQALKSDPDNLIATQKKAELYVLLKQPAEVYQTYMRLADLYAQAGQQARYEATWKKIVEFSLQQGNPRSVIPFEVGLRGGPEGIEPYLKARDAIFPAATAIQMLPELPNQGIVLPAQVESGSGAPGGNLPAPDALPPSAQSPLGKLPDWLTGILADTPDTYPLAPMRPATGPIFVDAADQQPLAPDWLTGILAAAPDRQPFAPVRHDVRLILVGEAGMGKSSLLRALKQQSFDPELPVTHGIQVDTLRLTHPQRQGRELTLSTWDFGGQQIYQATHQLFLTRRSIYLLVWNARQGPEVCHLHFWLDTINALAPKAPILLIATHADEWPPEINLPYYRKKYPQLVGQCIVSNKNSHGLDALKQQLLDLTANATLVGQKWSQNWLAAERELSTRREQYLERAIFLQVCKQHGIAEAEALGSFAPGLHDLGKILFFADDPLLSNLVVLKPQWISRAISAILDDRQTRQASGLLKHSDLSRIWTTDEDGQSYNPALYPAFLRLMERFDLCYQLDPERPGARATHCLVPLLLPTQPSLFLPHPPDSASTDLARAEIRYTLDFVPEGLMSWLLVRTHRYSQQLHWRTGAHLTYQGQQAHLELNLPRPELQLIVWGAFPYTFFLILKETLDALLERFQNLQVKREIPCTCQLYAHHPHSHDYDLLEQRFRKGESEVVCQQGSPIALLPLFYGLHAGSAAQITATVQQSQEALNRSSLSQVEFQRTLARIEQGQEFLWRDLARGQMLMSKELMGLSTFKIQKEKSPCPGLFVLEPEPGKLYKPQDYLSRSYRLHLLCEYPSGPHTLKGEPGYLLCEKKKWWKTMSPWLRRIVAVLKTGVPLGKAVGAVFDQMDVDRFANQIDLLNEILSDLPPIESVESVSAIEGDAQSTPMQRLEGAALRALAHFLQTADPAQHWHGLQRVVTPERTILWVCKDHTHIGETL